jgi:hypothetical protein
MGTDSVELAAARLRDAETSRIPCLPVRDLLGSTDVAAAYVVQLRNRELRFAAGARLVGRKIGVTSEAVPLWTYLWRTIDQPVRSSTSSPRLRATSSGSPRTIPSRPITAGARRGSGRCAH